MNKWIAATANFFLPGLGYLIAVPRKRALGAAWLAGALGLTWVEQVAIGPSGTGFAVMFGSVFLMNTAFAIDVWQEIQATEGAA